MSDCSESAAGGTGVSPVQTQAKACGYRDIFMVLGVPLEHEWPF
jgi:hypothetical protein